MFTRLRAFLWMALLCSGSGLLAAGAISFLIPWTYESRAVLEFTPRPRVVATGFWTEESDWLTGRAVLLRVIGKLDLGKPDGLDREAALERIHGMVSATRVDEPSRTLVTLRVRSDEPKLARDLAAEIITAFGAYRAEQMRQEQAVQLEELRKQVEQQTQAVAAAKRRLEEVTRDFPLDDRPSPPAAAEAPETPPAPMTAREIAEACRKLAADERQQEQPARVVLRERPELPKWPISPELPRNLVIGALCGLALSPLLTAATGGKRRRAKDPFDARSRQG